MVRYILYTALLFAVCGYAFLRGRSDERLVASVCVAASVASLLLLGPAGKRYSGVELGVLCVDILTFAAFLFVALRSDRFWPLWITGLQLTTSIGHVLKAIEPSLLPMAYAAALRLWSYPILLILLIASWRSARRRAALRQEPVPA